MPKRESLTPKKKIKNTSSSELGRKRARKGATDIKSACKYPERVMRGNGVELERLERENREKAERKVQSHDDL